MKLKAALAIASTLFSTATFAADADVERSAFFQALVAMAPQEAAYSFVIDQYLEVKCGRPQSVKHLKAVLSSHTALHTILALKAGDSAKAKANIQQLPCEP
jgi:hypothetical protein